MPLAHSISDLFFGHFAIFAIVAEGKPSSSILLEDVHALLESDWIENDWAAVQHATIAMTTTWVSACYVVIAKLVTIHVDDASDVKSTCFDHGAGLELTNPVLQIFHPIFPGPWLFVLNASSEVCAGALKFSLFHCSKSATSVFVTLKMNSFVTSA